MSQRVPRRHILQKSILALAGLSMAADCWAADRSWSNLAGGTFTTISNWQNGLFAGVNDAACFSNSSVFSPPGQATYTVSFSASAQNQAVKVRNDFVTFNLLGRTYTTTQITGNEIGTVAGGGTILVANSARLTIQNGTFNATGALTPQMLVGAVPGGNGSLTIGNAGVLAGAPNLFVGTASAFGTLTINGGTATTSTLTFGSGASGRGNGVMNGPFATMTSGRLFVGDAGAGTLSMTIAAILQNNGTAIIGNAAGASGFVNLDSSARWNQSGSLTIGAAGAGTVNVVNSAQLVGSSAVMANGTTSTATVRVGGPGSGSRWTNTGPLDIANFGNATLTVDGGGFVSAGTTIIGRSTASAGTLNIDSGASVSFGRLFVGNSGTATVNVTNGGVLNAGTTVMNSGSGGTSTMNISGVGSAAIFPRLSVADTAGGSINITDGGRLTCQGDTDIGFTFGNPTASGRVNVTGNGSRWINSGKINLFSGSGNAITITGGGTVECSAADIRGSTGLTVDGVGSRVLNTGSLDLSTSMMISNGGVVDNTNAAALSRVTIGSSARVQGAGSAWNIAGSLEIGGFDSRLSINSGGHVQAANTLVKTDGTILLSSSGSDLTTGNLTLGFGTNTGGENLFVQFGASLHTQSAQLAGHNSSVNLVSAVTVKDFGSLWQNTGSVIIGGDGAASFPGHAKMDVLNSGSVTNGDAFIAFSPSSTGTVTVGGGLSPSFPSSWTTNGNLYVGGSATADGGSGELRINTGGLVTVTDTLTLRDAGVIDLNGGTLTVGSLLGDLALIFQSGTLNITTQNPQIGDGNPLDGIILGTNRTVNVTNVTTIRPDGRLRMLGGRYLSAGGITNNGEILVDSGSRAIFENPIINNGSINVAANATIEFASNLSGPGSFVGPGTKILRTGSNAVVNTIDTGALTIVAGGASLTTNRISEASLTLLSNAVVTLNPDGSDANTSRLGSLSMASVGRLDLADNALVIDYTGATPADNIRALLASGFAAGSWNGNGINSSIAAAQNNRSLGFAEATDLFSAFPAVFAGQMVDPTTVLVRFTLPGDSNLDQIVNISDFAIVAANFNQISDWHTGDSNYDGITNISDFAALAANFNQTLPTDLPRQTVPEPGAVGTVVLLSYTLKRVRRRRRS